MGQVELTPESVEAIARRVAELLAADRSAAMRPVGVQLLPIAAPPDGALTRGGRRRDDLAGSRHGTPFMRRD
ncbi:MAG: hypothetical protein JWM60_1656 [Solirubrobacterales bacterium]|nr:hypothetical protein [Solirubrobacterales bacterium]